MYVTSSGSNDPQIFASFAAHKRGTFGLKFLLKFLARKLRQELRPKLRPKRRPELPPFQNAIFAENLNFARQKSFASIVQDTDNLLARWGKGRAGNRKLIENTTSGRVRPRQGTASRNPGAPSPLNARISLPLSSIPSASSARKQPKTKRKQVPEPQVEKDAQKSCHVPDCHWF